jgi:hypothetical protein
MQAGERALEQVPDFEEIVALVAATPFPRLGDEKGWPEQKPSARAARDTARWLVANGFTARRVRAARAAGADPVRAWVSLNGGDTYENRAVLSDAVVLAEVTAVEPGQLSPADRFRSTARFRVVETLAGDLRPGAAAVVRMESGLQPGGRYAASRDDPLVLPGLPGSIAVGDRYVLVLSSGMYAHRARVMGGSPAAPLGERWYVTTTTMQKVRGDAVLAAYDRPATTLPELRRRLGAR